MKPYVIQRIERMPVSVCLLFGAALGGGVSAGQNRPAFEVASVKPSDPQAHHPLGTGVYTYPGGRVVASNCTLAYLIQVAFDTDEVVFPGAPKWYSDERFEIDARPPATSASRNSNPSSFKNPPNEEQQAMLQTLLAERFQLKCHREAKERPVYLLTRGAGPLKLQEPKNRNEYSWAGSAAGGAPFQNGIAGINISMAQFARRLTQPLGRPVLDRTGLTGFFDFKYDYTSDDLARDVISSILASIRGLGLKLEPSTAPVENIVIEHVGKPSEN
jgi:uncharacterized protein (TIGR03435 family)